MSEDNTSSDSNRWLEYAEWRGHIDARLDFIINELKDTKACDKNMLASVNTTNNRLSDIQKSLDNHLYHHQQLEKQRNQSGTWIRWVVPTALTIINMVLAYKLL